LLDPAVFPDLSAKDKPEWASIRAVGFHQKAIRCSRFTRGRIVEIPSASTAFSRTYVACAQRTRSVEMPLDPPITCLMLVFRESPNTAQPCPENPGACGGWGGTLPLLAKENFQILIGEKENGKNNKLSLGRTTMRNQDSKKGGGPPCRRRPETLRACACPKRSRAASSGDTRANTNERLRDRTSAGPWFRTAFSEQKSQQHLSGRAAIIRSRATSAITSDRRSRAGEAYPTGDLMRRFLDGTA